MSNMYPDSKKQWNVMVGCKYDCVYCLKSFQAQMKRQKHNCDDCYTYTPHFHEKRLHDSLPRTENDEFIWACSSADITFAKPEWMEAIIERIRELSHKTFFFQSKNPIVFQKYSFPDNVLLGTTLETNRNGLRVSKAPALEKRYIDFLNVEFPRKVVTIEPIMSFDLLPFIHWIKNINPERVYIGYDTRKSGLIEPTLSQTKQLIECLKEFTKVKLKHMKGMDN